ncbi:MAG: D-alanine--D-alanine ligase [Saprospiraceae bacterium]
MDKKLKIAILFGGRSTEHEISLLSAQNVIKSLDPSKYEAVLIGIDKSGKWYFNDDSLKLLNDTDAKTIALGNTSQPVLISQNAGEKTLISSQTGQSLGKIDVIFPVLHGSFGEDGSVQGLARLANIPCVGCDVLGSAVGMDKDIMKRILRDAGIPVAKWMTQRKSAERLKYSELTAKLGNEIFIKPANLGSSVGVSHVKNQKAYDEALSYALEFDPKVIIEEQIIGREIECAVLGNHNPQASLPGEVIPRDQFYSFENKYLDEKGAILKTPAELDENQIRDVQKVAIDCFTVLECRGMARVDVFLQEDGRIVVNEINTIPGFTNISMYPKLWEVSGLDQTSLISRLIDLAIEHHTEQNALRLKA